MVKEIQVRTNLIEEKKEGALLHKAAKKLGDVAGRKMIWPQTGVEPGWDFDFVQAVFTTTIGAYGKNWTNFWEKSEDMPELEALAALGGSCTNERSFTIIPVKS